MSDQTSLPPLTARRLRRPLVLTYLGILCERLFRAFWPLWTLALIVVASVLLGFHDQLRLEVVWVLAAVAVGLGIAALWYGVRRFRWPGRADAINRLDQSMRDQPISALKDLQAIGAGDPSSEKVWRTHRLRMIARISDEAKPVQPDLRLSRRDPYGMRYVALTLFCEALLFGSILKVESLTALAPGQASALASGPTWEGWIEPPNYTGRPSLYLNDIPAGAVDIPEGSQISLRLYGDLDVIGIRETISANGNGEVLTGASSRDITAVQDGELAIEAPSGESWQITILPDHAPRVQAEGPMEVEADGEFAQAFTSSDDHGVVTGQARFDLDLNTLSRRYGLAAEPEARDPLIVDLPMPFTGDRTQFTEVLVENFTKHPWVGLPVTLTLSVEDATGAKGLAVPEELSALPGRRFFDPLANAIVEQRRDLLWTRENAGRVAAVLRAISHRPEDIFRKETNYLRLRFITRRLENGARYGMSDEQVDEYAEALWSLALRIEEGDLSNALERLRRAQDRLSEAMENGASNEEIAELMQELRDAIQEYMRQLAQQQGEDQETAENQPSQEITGEQLQSLLDQLQELMEQGRMAEAQALLDQLAQMMENMQMAQNGQQPGQGGEGQQAMNGLRETLRDQQNLSDESFQGLQDQFNQGQQQGQGQGQGTTPGQPQQGQGQGQAPGQQNGEDQDLGRMLADRQDSLRETLRQQQQGLPGNGEAADDAREALDRAGRAMDEAEQNLRENDLAGAIDNQSEAMDALRDGIQSLGEELAQQQQQQGQQGQQMGQGGPAQNRDPLGRENGADGQVGTRDNLLQDEDVYRRARDLLDEIRRRSGEQDRPDVELDYLRRLLDRF